MSSTTMAVTGTIERLLATPPRRLHILGGPGSGKTSLAREIGDITGLPVHHLDEIARLGGGNGPLRDADERDRMLADILATDGWVTEGVHLGWTEPVFRDAEVIVWLDYVTWTRATRRIVHRFVGGAFDEMRSRPIRERFTRFGDYGRNLCRLGGAIRESHRYYRAADRVSSRKHEPVQRVDAGHSGDRQRPSERTAPGTSGSWTMASHAVAGYEAKLVHCRRADDVDEVLRRLR